MWTYSDQDLKKFDCVYVYYRCVSVPAMRWYVRVLLCVSVPPTGIQDADGCNIASVYR